MRYIRFLKTPRIVSEKNSKSAHVYCLITITSDLGDSFLPHDVTLSAELIRDSAASDSSDTDNIIVWKTIQWTAGMRTLPVSLPLSRNSKPKGPLLVRIGTESKSRNDEFERLLNDNTSGVVSAWSAPFNVDHRSEAVKTVERRFQVDQHFFRIYEETGESIARHLWDAGITLSCHLPRLLQSPEILGKVKTRATQRNPDPRLHVLELGSGCGMVGIALAQLIPQAEVYLTDLPEAREIVTSNLQLAGQKVNHESIAFHELDWEERFPESLFTQGIDLVIAADCTYNADSSPALVNTIREVARLFPAVTVAIAMKKRHSSEDVFFDLMSEAKFRTVSETKFPLPGDEEVGEEMVILYTFEYSGP